MANGIEVTPMYVLTLIDYRLLSGEDIDEIMKFKPLRQNGFAFHWPGWKILDLVPLSELLWGMGLEYGTQFFVTYKGIMVPDIGPLGYLGTDLYKKAVDEEGRCR